MSTFARVIELMERSHHDEEYDEKAIATIKTGLKIDDEFWENFKRVCNSPGLCELLGVSKTNISTWYGKIDKYLTHVRNTEQNVSKKNNIVKTGYEQ
jgi:hypothetical protein